MNKCLLFAFSVVIALSMLTFATPKTYAATNTHLSSHSQTVIPAASGGGCDVWEWNPGPEDIAAKACISYQFGYHPDAYVSFYPTSTVAVCQVSVILYDASSNANLGNQSWNCVSAANAGAQNQHYGTSVPIKPDSAYTEVVVSLRYTNHTISYVFSDSPASYW